jgi:DNA repair protein RadA/Sms
MTRLRTVHRCRNCGAATARWVGRCPTCGEWNALEEEAQPAASATAAGAGPGAVVALAAVDPNTAVPTPTGVPELDRVLGGGLLPGSVTLVGGEPGVGKSTLLLQVLLACTGAGGRALLVCAEESARQVRLRAERLGVLDDRLALLAGTDVTAVAGAVAASGADLVVVDSIQAVREPSTPGPAGTVTQVRTCAEILVELAKTTEVPVVLVGHVTKDGALAGPRHLEHVVDTVLTVEGDRHHALRLVRAVKHRFGPTGEVGLFEMGEAGLEAVADPQRLLLGDRQVSQPGCVVLPTIEGQRALLVEVQALVAPAFGTQPRRQVQGLDPGRLGLLLGVLHVRAGVTAMGSDVFTSVIGGIKVTEPAADLAVVLALASAATERALPADMVAFGEVGLGGELRRAVHAPRRMAEAARLGFRYAIVPPACPDGPPGMRTLRVADVREAITLLHG